MKNLTIALLLATVSILQSQGQDFSNKGKEFWVVFPPHQPSGQGNNVNLANLSLYISSDLSSSGRIIIGSTVIPFSITPNQTQEFILNRSLTYISQSESANDQLQSNLNKIVIGKGIRVLVDQGKPPVVVYGHIYAGSRSAATIVLPSSVMQRKYMVMTYTQTPNGTNAGEEAKSQFSVVAMENDTKVRITLRKNGILSPSSYEITLNNAGDVYQFQDDNDLTGTEIESVSSNTSVSCKKISVFSGSSSLKIPFDIPNTTPNTSIDPLFQQLYPINSWGYNYFITPFRARNKLIFRILAKEDGTVVDYNGKTKTINKGQFIESNAQVDLPPFTIKSNKQICVAQFSYTQNQETGLVGDPEMIILNSVEQNINDVSVFLSPKNNITDQNINVVIRNDGIPGFRINGAVPSATFIPIPNTDYSYLQQNFNVSQGSFLSIRMNAAIGFNAFCYGFGSFESYGYSAGTNVKDLNQFISFENEYANVPFPATCKGTPFKFSITLPFKPIKLVWNFNNVNGNLLDETGVVATDPPMRTNGGLELVPDGVVASPVDPTKSLYVYRLNSKYNFNAAGDFPINLIATNSSSDGCTGEQNIEYTIKVIDPPSVNIALTSSGCTNDNVSFDIADLNTGGRPIDKYIWNIDNIVDNRSSFKKSFQLEGQKNVTLQVVSDIGCVSPVVSKTFSLSQKPVIDFKINNIPCLDKNVEFENLSSPVGNSTIDAFEWLFDNANADASISPVKKFTSSAIDVKLSGTTNTGCFVSVVKKITINPNPVPKLELPESCITDVSTFRALSTIDGNESMQHIWNFGDQNAIPAANVATGNTVIHKYTAAGPYTVQLKVTSQSGCISDTSVNFKINGANPVTDFDLVQPATLCSNEELKIIDRSYVDIGDIIRVKVYWEWNAANPSSSRVTVDEEPAKKMYDTSYTPFLNIATKQVTVRMMAYSGESSSCITTKEKTFILKGSPTVSFSDMPLICQEATPRQITQALYTDVSGIPSGSFDYSGTAVSNTGVFDPTAAGPGIFYIKYRFTSSNGCSDTLTKSITVLKSPIAQFTFSDTLCEKNNLLFTSTSISEEAGSINEYLWSLSGQQKTSILPNIQHAFPSFGPAEVSLNIRTVNGCTNTQIKTVDIKPLPIVSFDLPLAVCLPEGKALFKNTSAIPSGSFAGFKWNFGDPNNNSSSVSADGLHNYSQLGTYPVKLTILSKAGCIDSLTQNLETVFPQPKAVIQSLDSVCIGKDITYTDISSNLTHPAKNWYWDFDNQAKDSLKSEVTYKHPNPGKYTVRMVLRTSVGCYSDTAKKQVVIHPYPVVNAGPDLDVLDDGERVIGASAAGTNLVFKWTPSTYLDKTDVLRPLIINPIEDIKYKLSVTGSGGCTTLDSIVVKALKSILPPNTFTPNGDGNNDFWEIKNFNLYNFGIIEIYSAQGQFITRIKSSEKWDGTQNGKPVPSGTYYYVIDPRSGRKRMSGYVTILK